ncbi:MAG: NitT/TauT family transport system permease protein [Methanolobus sp.]|jgi:NitT/TauT family transport system permease protein|nr:NitT/TauT family transport system permease protein [Methanolobus sp.]MDK2834117.1 NitT/TauT family transport system permease protein [Methanolobus sp.]MDK2911669.1 NitT/TauT family transport system permease protein [Methanolobus sp.]
MSERNWNTDIIGFILPALIFITWYLVTLEGKVPGYLIPSPVNLVRVAVDFATGYANLTPYGGTLPAHALASVQRVALGFGLAAAFGLPLGFLTGRINLAKSSLDPTVHLIRIIPGIGWLPIAMVWFGVGETTTLFLVALAAFFPIYVNAAQGASSVSPLLIRAGRMLGASRLTLFTTVIIPAAMPSTVAGLRLGLGISWAYLVLGELTGVTYGLGAVMMDARMLGHVEMILVPMIFIGLLGRVSDMLLVGSFKRLDMFREESKQ